MRLLMLQNRAKSNFIATGSGLKLKFVLADTSGFVMPYDGGKR